MNPPSGTHRKSSRAGRAGRVGRLLVGAVGAFALGCNLVVGSYEFRDEPAEAGSPDVGRDVFAPESDAGCDVDLTTTCFACEPATNEQFLNSCGESPCTPFDRSRLEGLLLPDGALPPLPQPEGGT